MYFYISKLFFLLYILYTREKSLLILIDNIIRNTLIAFFHFVSTRKQVGSHWEVYY